MARGAQLPVEVPAGCRERALGPGMGRAVWEVWVAGEIGLLSAR